MTQNKLTIEKRQYEEFMDKFKYGYYGAQRLGQAFYNWLKGHSLCDRSNRMWQLDSLYEKDGKSASDHIKSIIVLS